MFSNAGAGPALPSPPSLTDLRGYVQARLQAGPLQIRMQARAYLGARLLLGAPSVSASRKTDGCGVEPLSGTRPANRRTSLGSRNLRAPRQPPPPVAAGSDARGDSVRALRPLLCRSSPSEPSAGDSELQLRGTEARRVELASTAPRIDPSDLQHTKERLTLGAPTRKLRSPSSLRRSSRRASAAKESGPARLGRDLRIGDRAVRRFGPARLEPGSTPKVAGLPLRLPAGRPSSAPRSSKACPAACSPDPPPSFRSRAGGLRRRSLPSSALYLQCGSWTRRLAAHCRRELQNSNADDASPGVAPPPPLRTVRPPRSRPPAAPVPDRTPRVLPKLPGGAGLRPPCRRPPYLHT